MKISFDYRIFAARLFILLAIVFVSVNSQSLWGLDPSAVIRGGKMIAGDTVMLSKTIAWARLPLIAVQLRDLTTLSKIENIFILIERGVEEGKIVFSQGIRLRAELSSVEDGDKLLLRFLQSDAKSFEEFRKDFRLVEGGSSEVLGRNIGKPTSNDWAAHHVIPSELREHRVLEKIGFELDAAPNGISLPRRPGVDPVLPLHTGSHPGYTAAVQKALDEIPSYLDIKETAKRVEAIQNGLRDKLKSGASLHEKYGGQW